MVEDQDYRAAALSNRGRFTENFAAERLELVFGRDRVFRNIDLWESKGKKIGEIDALVVFADRVIIVQAKSKKLTLAARMGNEVKLKDDFKHAIQDACDQAYLCSERILRGSLLTDAAGKEIRMPAPAKQIYLICLVSDHYPALSTQAFPQI
jgi:hypothetical protein